MDEEPDHPRQRMSEEDALEADGDVSIQVQVAEVQVVVGMVLLVGN